jgi:hypothetical protein
MDNVAGHLEASFGDNSRGNIKNLANDKGRSNYDQPLNNTTSLVYDLPFGKGGRFLSGPNGVVDGVIGGWRLTLINTVTSGLPANLTYGPAAQFVVGSSLTYRPNQIQPNLYRVEWREGRSEELPEHQRGRRFRPTAASPSAQPGRNTVRGPSFSQADLGLHKSFRLINETTRLEFRMEAFNLFNKTNFQVPDTNANNIRRDSTGAAIAGGSYGTIRSAYPAREIQFALKLLF